MVRTLPDYLVNEALELARRDHVRHEHARRSTDLTTKERLRSIYYKMAERGDIGRRLAARAIIDTFPKV